MRLLKSPASVRVVPRSVTDARARAAALIEQAEADARAIRDAARAEADAVHAEARRAGEQSARAEASALMARAAARAAQQAEQEAGAVAQLAVEVARAILGREAAASTDVVRDVAQRALARVRRARRVVLKVHPDELDAARAEARAWLPAGMDPAVLGCEADPLVERGGVIVESELGRLDARLETQLEALRRALAGGGASR